MGRPINKRNFGSGAGNIQVTSWRKATGAESQTAGSIVRQRSTRKFLVNANGAFKIRFFYHQKTISNHYYNSKAYRLLCLIFHISV